MHYMLLIIEPLGQRRARTEVEGRELYERMRAYGQTLQQRGVLLAGESLQSQEGAVRVQSRGGQSRVVDGPFAEAKEMIGGFFLVDCAHREAAIALAAECPAAQWCTVEVRAIAPCYE